MNIKKILRDTLTIKFDKAFGLDIGDRSVEIIEMEKVFKFSVITYGRSELPAGVVENGVIMNQNILAEKIKKLLKDSKPKRVSTNKVIVSLPESQIYVRCFEVDSKLKSTALTNAITDKVSQSLPININKAYWDFLERPLADKTKKLIVFISVPKDVASSYVKFCNSIGLEVVSLCTESLSLARTLLTSSNKQTLIIDIGSGTTSLNFFDSNDKVNMTSVIPVAGGHMTQAIVDKLKVEPAEADDMKVKYGLKEGSVNIIRPIILPIIEDIINETKQAIAYYEQTFKQKLDDIYIIGGSAMMIGMIDFMKSKIGREVKVGVSSSGVSLKSVSIKDNYFPLYANVIGLGMLGASGEFEDLNLLKKMPANEVNSVSKLNLFNLGYLSKVNTVRAVINNKFFLVVMVALIGVIFAILLQQTKNFGYTDTDFIIPANTAVRPKVVQNIGTSTQLISASSTSLKNGTSTATSKATTSTSTKLK